MSRFSALALSLLLGAASAQAQEVWTVDKVHSEVSFQVRHFVSKVRGRFTDFSGTITVFPDKPEQSTAEFTIKTASVDTDNTKRDDHLRSADFFDAEKHPEISFKSSKVKAVGKDQFEVTGTFTLHGVSKEITLPVSYLGVMTQKRPDGRESVRSGFATQTKLNRKDYGIVWNTLLDNGGTVLGDDVTIDINLETIKQQPKPAAN
jgi:polyisoprenoid-binding protein YceI